MNEIQGPCAQCGQPLGWSATGPRATLSPKYLPWCKGCVETEEKKITYYFKVPGGFSSVRI